MEPDRQQQKLAKFNDAKKLSKFLKTEEGIAYFDRFLKNPKAVIQTEKASGTLDTTDRNIENETRNVEDDDEYDMGLYEKVEMSDEDNSSGPEYD
ncbi:hypothetical protein U1Q18_049022 [Sarracenia purpurea var. burkii]